jgi:signal transduction histidine kinase
MENEALELDDIVKALSVDFELKPGELQLVGDLGMVKEDTFNLRRVLENLVGNAIKYHDGRTDRRIVVSAKADGERSSFSVSDNGPGIDSKFHERIFDVFQTLREGEANESTGIGLSIVKKTVERHGGRVLLTSKLGEGSTFSFDWPSGAREWQPKLATKAA